jgi:hypothetical protein
MSIAIYTKFISIANFGENKGLLKLICRNKKRIAGAGKLALKKR